MRQGREMGGGQHLELSMTLPERTWKKSLYLLRLPLIPSSENKPAGINFLLDFFSPRLLLIGSVSIPWG